MPVAAQTAPPKPDRDSKCIGERNWGLVYLAARAVLLAFLAASCALRPLGQTATPRVSLRMSTTFTSKIIPSWRRTRIRRSSYSDSLAGFDYSLNTSSFLPDFESANGGTNNWTISKYVLNSLSGGGGNLRFTVNTDGKVVIDVSYEFIPAAGFTLPTSAPEPASLSLIGLGMAALGLIRSRKRRSV